MSVESSFLRDRPATADEIRDLSDGLPLVFFVGEYRDMARFEFVNPNPNKERIETSDGYLEKIESESWVVRMN